MQEICLHPLREQARLEEAYANLRPLSADKRFNHHSNFKERRSIASYGAERSAPSFGKIATYIGC